MPSFLNGSPDMDENSPNIIANSIEPKEEKLFTVSIITEGNVAGQPMAAC